MTFAPDWREVRFTLEQNRPSASVVSYIDDRSSRRCLQSLEPKAPCTCHHRMGFVGRCAHKLSRLIHLDDARILSLPDSKAVSAQAKCKKPVALRGGSV
jgi:hypothetical protein